MSAYYPTQGSHYTHAPMMMPSHSSHGHSHHGHGGYPASGYYSQPQTGYAGSGVVYAQPGYAPNGMSAPAQVITVPSSSRHRRHRSRRRHHSSRHGSSHRSHSGLTLGDRIKSWFGFGPYRDYKVKSDKSSWGFLGRSRRKTYVDARTGAEVDRKGRPVYRV